MDTTNRFAVLYSFVVIDEKENDFVNAWTELTKLIYQFEGSHGSRLHKVNENLFISYGQWPDKTTWEQAGNNLPESANEFRKRMRESCSEIKTEFEMEVLEDLLADKKFNKM